MSKLKSQSELFNIIKRLQKQNKRVVFARGCFDILHPGHLYYLKKAKSLGDVLVVWINTDQSVRKLKGAQRPLFSEEHRARVLAGLAFVDFVSYFQDKEGLDLVKKFKPQIVAVDRVSAEYLDAVRAYGGKIELIPLLKQYSTTKIIKQILKTYA